MTHAPIPVGRIGDPSSSGDLKVFSSEAILSGVRHLLTESIVLKDGTLVGNVMAPADLFLRVINGSAILRTATLDTQGSVVKQPLRDGDTVTIPRGIIYSLECTKGTILGGLSHQP